VSVLAAAAGGDPLALAVVAGLAAAIAYIIPPPRGPQDRETL